MESRLLMFGFIVLCNGLSLTLGIPPKCAAVTCPTETWCPNPIRTPGQCCGTCKMDCRVVRCGSPPPESCNPEVPPGLCCPVCGPVKEKPGTCPQMRDRFGHCAEICSSDRDCRGRQKCCSNGCGHDCMDPVQNCRRCQGFLGYLRNRNQG
ncbi:hypothetical protein ACF0H5_012031 [Mactra antiquata]